MQIWSGLHGSGIMSSSPNTPALATSRRICVSSTRLVAPSNPSLRPASCTGWKVTPRTHDQRSASWIISATSPSLTPRLTTATSVVEIPAASSASRASRQPRAAQVEQRLVVERIDLQVDLKPRRVFGQPGDELGVLRDPHPVGVDH